MKKTLAILLAAMMLSGGAFATEEQPVIEAVPIPQDVEFSIDLNGDGAPETIAWTMLPGEFDSYLTLYVENSGADVIRHRHETDIIWATGVYLADFDGDSEFEFLLSGDVMSDDYVTYCVDYKPEGLSNIPFKNTFRGDGYDEYYEYGYGYVSEIKGNIITLMGSQDVLGTYFGSRQFSFMDGVFETCDDGLWYFDIDAADPEMWEYRALIPVTEIPAVFVNEEGQETEGKLNAGERIMIYASDTETVAWFVCENGTFGYLNLEPDVENWGSMIGGVSESELFEFVPYAD